MAKSELKTKQNDASIDDFIGSVENVRRKQDAFELLALFRETTGNSGKMWGNAIIGFGKYHYSSKRSPQEGDWPAVAFSPRKLNLSVYLMDGFDNYKSDLSKLGKHKTGVGCLYINKLSDVDLVVLKKIIKQSYLGMDGKNIING